MTARPNAFEQFLMLFDALKGAAKDEPQRLVTFHNAHQGLRLAVQNLGIMAQTPQVI